VQALIDTVVRNHTSFHLFDFILYPQQFLRGRGGEAWNANGRVVTARDICLARNGGGDIYVWNADTGGVRLLGHDSRWEPTSEFKNLDLFVEQAMLMEVERADASHFDDGDAAYVERFRLALEIADDDMLDDEVREKLDAL
jgi:hypothetical protein